MKNITSVTNLIKIAPFLRSYLLAKPVIIKENCIRCGICNDVCPVEGKAIIWREKKNHPVYDYKKCIRCFCCQELCPEGAIMIKPPLFGLPQKK